MTRNNKLANIQTEIERGEASRKAALLLSENDLILDAISRLYYWVFHCVRALLLTEGLEPKTHEGVLRLLGLHFVKTQILTPEDAHIFARLMKYRETADDSPGYVFTKEDFQEFFAEGQTLCAAIQDRLKDFQE